METYFHGTRANIQQFNIKGSGKHGLGFYFTKSFSDARAFASILAGRGLDTDITPRVYKVCLRIQRPFDTMSVDHAKEVAAFYGFNYRVPKFAGGPKEHYHHLVNQMIKNGVTTKESANETIARAGFDAIYCEFFEHMIALYEEQIEILDQENV